MQHGIHLLKPDLRSTRLLERQYRNICWRLQMMLQLELSVDMNRFVQTKGNGHSQSSIHHLVSLIALCYTLCAIGFERSDMVLCWTAELVKRSDGSQKNTTTTWLKKYILFVKLKNLICCIYLLL